jgi:hypothetical protein
MDTFHGVQYYLNYQRHSKVEQLDMVIIVVITFIIKINF